MEKNEMAHIFAYYVERSRQTTHVELVFLSVHEDYVSSGCCEPNGIALAKRASDTAKALDLQSRPYCIHAVSLGGYLAAAIALAAPSTARSLLCEAGPPPLIPETVVNLYITALPEVPVFLGNTPRSIMSPVLKIVARLAARLYDFQDSVYGECLAFDEFERGCNVFNRRSLYCNAKDLLLWQPGKATQWEDLLRAIFGDDLHILHAAPADACYEKVHYPCLQPLLVMEAMDALHAAACAPMKKKNVPQTEVGANVPRKT